MSDETDYGIAAEDEIRFPGRTIPGMLARPAPIRNPNGVQHAMASGASLTLCGLDVATMFDFSTHRFRAVPERYRCSRCDDRAGHPSMPSFQSTRWPPG